MVYLDFAFLLWMIPLLSVWISCALIRVLFTLTCCGCCPKRKSGITSETSDSALRSAKQPALFTPYGKCRKTKMPPKQYGQMPMYSMPEGFLVKHPEMGVVYPPEGSGSPGFYPPKNPWSSGNYLQPHPWFKIPKSVKGYEYQQPRQFSLTPSTADSRNQASPSEYANLKQSNDNQLQSAYHDLKSSTQQNKSSTRTRSQSSGQIISTPLNQEPAKQQTPKQESKKQPVPPKPEPTKKDPSIITERTKQKSTKSDPTTKSSETVSSDKIDPTQCLVAEPTVPYAIPERVIIRN